MHFDIESVYIQHRVKRSYIRTSCQCDQCPRNWHCQCQWRTQTHTCQNRAPIPSQPAETGIEHCNLLNCQLQQLYLTITLQLELHSTVSVFHKGSASVLTAPSQAVTSWLKHREYRTATTGCRWLWTMLDFIPGGVSSFSTASCSVPTASSCWTGLKWKAGGDGVRIESLNNGIILAEYIMWDVMWCHVMSWDVMWCSWDVMWCHEVMWCSWDVMWCHVSHAMLMRCHVMLMWCHVMLMSCHVMSCESRDVMWCSCDVIWASFQYTNLQTSLAGNEASEVYLQQQCRSCVR